MRIIKQYVQEEMFEKDTMETYTRLNEIFQLNGTSCEQCCGTVTEENNMTNQQQQIQQILDLTKIAKKKLWVGREV